MKKQYQKIDPAIYEQTLDKCAQLYNISTGIDDDIFPEKAIEQSDNLLKLMFLNIVKFMNLTPIDISEEYYYDFFFIENFDEEDYTDGSITDGALFATGGRGLNEIIDNLIYLLYKRKRK